jgi:hypothetical protein
MKKRLNHLITTPLIASMFFIGCGKKEETFLKNPTEIKKQEISIGDTYWEYSKKLMKNNNKLNNLDTREIIYYLKHKLNKGKELYVGEEVNLPKYN